MEEEPNSTGYEGSTEHVTASDEGYVIPDVVVVEEKPEDPPAAPFLLPTPPLPKPEIKPVDDNVLKRRDRNNRVLRSKATQTRIGSLWQIGTISSSTWNATPPSYFPTAPFTSWRDGNSLKGHYFQVYHEQTNSDFYLVQNANGTQTYVEKTLDEKFHYYNKNTEQWEPFTPAGYETSAQKIQRMKNIAAATGVFGEKYQKLQEFMFLSLATLAAGGPAGRALFNVVYQFLNQLMSARIKGEPFSPDYFDLLIDTIPIKTTPAGEFYVELVKEIFKAFIDITSKEGVAVLDKNNRVKGEILNIVVSTIISKYGIRLFGSGLGRTEHEVVDALLKTTTLISTIVTLGLYELE